MLQEQYNGDSPRNILTLRIIEQVYLVVALSLKSIKTLPTKKFDILIFEILDKNVDTNQQRQLLPIVAQEKKGNEVRKKGSDYQILEHICFKMDKKRWAGSWTVGWTDGRTGKQTDRWTDGQ